MNKAKTVILFLTLTLINGWIFYLRNRFEYIPQASYEALYQECSNSCEKKWGAFVKPYPAQELQEAKQISNEWIISTDATTTLAKIQRISSYIHNQFKDKNGNPSPAVLALSPLQQFKTLRSKPDEKLWCGIYAQMLSYFCWSQGITTRYIEIMNPGDHHVVNECYIPELKKWVLVDAMFNLAGLRDSTGRLLNLQDFRSALKQGHSINTLYDKAIGDSSLFDPSTAFIRTYYLPENTFNYHYYTSTDYAYRASEKVKRYFLPVSWYEIYDSNKNSNLPFVLKLVFFTLWIVSIGLLLRQLRLK